MATPLSHSMCASRMLWELHHRVHKPGSTKEISCQFRLIRCFTYQNPAPPEKKMQYLSVKAAIIDMTIIKVNQLTQKTYKVKFW